MMRNIHISAIVFAMMSTAAPAALNHNPALDQAIGIPGNLGNGLLNLMPGQTYTHPENVTPSAYNQVVGFSFAAIATNIGDQSTWWASDTQLTITLRDHDNNAIATHTLGGYLNLNNPWDFQGSQSTNNGLYIHGLNSPHGNGDADYVWLANPLSLTVPVNETWKWEFTFKQDTNLTHIIWKGIVINLHMIPSPAVVPLLVMAVLMPARRRRRTIS